MKGLLVKKATTGIDCHCHCLVTFSGALRSRGLEERGKCLAASALLGPICVALCIRSGSSSDILLLQDAIKSRTSSSKVKTTPTLYSREMGTICPFGVFPCFTVFFCFKVGHCPFET